ncbi:Na+/H+ antiporter NhaC [Siminovitchia terrae]|uniref:Na+/H+ antiporter NhaC n=1 Tax=Siminovitchia terrae TaxID=1914933 RepID=A0A429XDV7_SIMTE|nr:Na+/H+ antiporter NhaC [Siminovitchia terrae]RST61638.1 Na+/H+ antiporter NhaC [Siminovitchia terrae]GIN92402.1 Na+/H+ antiporter NhaC [Siminovitchia terrae]GIN97207.1 Na+/H+ antiporter NhaC [Siminovitchia terrae]
MQPVLSTKKNIILMVVAIVIVFGGIAGIKAPSTIVLITGGAAIIFLSLLWGIKWEDIERDILRSIGHMMIPILILLAVGMMIGVWMLSGTIPFLVYYGLILLKPSIFLFVACLVCAIMTLMNGNSWATIGTVGVALMGVSMGLEIPLYYTAAAVVVGAIFGDKVSPLSDSTILASSITDVELMDHVKHLLYTTVPGLVISLILYLIIGFQFNNETVDSENISAILNSLNDNFNLNPLVMLPPLAVLILISRRAPALPVYGVGIFLGAVIGAFFQDRSIMEVAEALSDGYSYDTGLDIVNQIVQQGGLSSMLSTVAILIAAAIFGAPLQTSGLIDIMLNKIKQFAKTGRSMMASCLTLHTGFFTIIGSYYVTYAVFGPVLKNLYDDYGLHRKNLSRTFEDTGTALAPLVPWSVTGAFIANTLQVPNGEFILYAPMIYLGIVFAVIYIMTGFGIAKSDQQIPRNTSKQIS